LGDNVFPSILTFQAKTYETDLDKIWYRCLNDVCRVGKMLRKFKIFF